MSELYDFLKSMNLHWGGLTRTATAPTDVLTAAIQATDKTELWCGSFHRFGVYVSYFNDMAVVYSPSSEFAAAAGIDQADCETTSAGYWQECWNVTGESYVRLDAYRKACEQEARDRQAAAAAKASEALQVLAMQPDCEYCQGDCQLTGEVCE